MVGFYHTIEHLFVRSPYKGVLQRAHIMRNRNHNIAQNFTYLRRELKSENYGPMLTMNILAFSQLSQARFCPFVVLYESSARLNTIVNNFHIMNV